MVVYDLGARSQAMECVVRHAYVATRLTGANPATEVRLTDSGGQYESNPVATYAITVGQSQNPDPPTLAAALEGAYAQIVQLMPRPQG